MNIQSLSIVVPGTKCINNCKFCVSRTHQDIIYDDYISDNISDTISVPNKLSYFEGFYNRALHYAKDLGCTTLMLTGECEPQQNKKFLEWFFTRTDANNLFHNIEIQTTGAGLTDTDIIKLRRQGVNTFSISMSSFDSVQNSEIINDVRNPFKLPWLTSRIKVSGSLLRLSLNLNKEFYQYSPEELFKKAKDLGADQVTLRKLYKAPGTCSQNDWIEANCDSLKDDEYFNYVKICGKPLERLPYGNIKYSVDGIGVVADGDCMAKDNLNEIRYLILRPDCHLYTRWDDPASIIF